MNDCYRVAFYDAVKTVEQHQGYDIPEEVTVYVIMLLSSKVEDKSIPPDNTFTETFFKIKTGTEAKQFADNCLFITGVYPKYGERRGINRSFIRDLGSMGYSITAQTSDNTLFSTLSNQFYFISDFIEQVVNFQKLPHSNLFR